MECVEKLKQIIGQSRKLIFFGGAGVSTASGIPDFRGAGGIFKKDYGVPAEIMLSHGFYVTHKEEFFAFYKKALVYPDAKPNAVHIKLAELETSGKDVTVITQNVDGLHQEAGSRKVLELHGSVHRNYCERCGKFYGLEYILSANGIPKCENCGGDVKPDVVLYGEQLNAETLKSADEAVASADTMIVAGTGLAVYPAAMYATDFRGENLIVVNKSETPVDARAKLVIREDMASVFEKL